MIRFAFRPLLAALSMSICVCAAADSPAPVDTALLGFTADGSSAQRALEARFDAQLSASEMRNWQQADQYAAITAKVLDGYRAELDKLTALLQANAR